MARKILMNVAEGDECRIAVLEDGKLYEYFVDRPSQLKHVGNIYKGLINNVEPGIQAAFVDVGLERNGFLHVSDTNYAYEKQPKLTELFPRTLRIKEPLADAVQMAQTERDVEQVEDFVGDGNQQHRGSDESGRLTAIRDASDSSDSDRQRATEDQSDRQDVNRADADDVADSTDSGRPPAAAERQSEFLDRAPAQQGHAVTNSPLQVEPGSAPEVVSPGQPANGEQRRRRRRGRRGRRSGDSGRFSPVAQNGSAPLNGSQSASPAFEPDDTERGDEPLADTVSDTATDWTDRTGTAQSQAPADAAPVAGTDSTANAPAVAASAAEDSPAATPEGAAPVTSENKQEAPAHRQRRRRTPKLRGGRMPKRVLEAEGASAEGTSAEGGADGSTDASTDAAPSHDSDAPRVEPDATGTRDIDGNAVGSADPSGPQYRYHRGPLPKIQNLLRRNQEVVVQVTKASQGGKGPGLSTFVSLPGRYMVLTPTSERGGVSRKIEDGSARNELRKILDRLPVPEGMGVIIRTAAIDRTHEDLMRDLNYLLRMWTVITQRIEEAEAPALLYSDSDPAIRAVRDYFTAETSEIVIDDKVVYERVLAFFDHLMPTFKDRVKLYQSDVPLFFANGLETEIEHIFDKKVPLKSGGYLFVEQTEALVSIDVNSGKFTSAGDAEKTAYLTNLEAIPEICRQLRLRDLAGIVCCDLIDMASARHRTDIENALRRDLRKDRARTKVARMSPFGVIEMTRQRVRPSIKAYTYVTCPTCTGFGMVRSAETMCLGLVRRMKLALCDDKVLELAVQVHPHVLSHLHSEFREDIDDLEETFDKRIVFEYSKDLTLGQTRFFYVNDRAVRVIYDMDQRINNYVKNEGAKSQSNVAAPVGASGTAGPLSAASGESRGRSRRRGGRRQREREQERVQREARIKSEGDKAVNFGATMPELPPMERITEKSEPRPNQGRNDRRGRNDRGDRRPRADSAAKPVATKSSEASPVASNAPAESAAASPAAKAADGKPAEAKSADGRPEGRGRRGRRGGRRHREREARRAAQQGNPSTAKPASEPHAASAPAPATSTPAPAAPAAPAAAKPQAARPSRRPAATKAAVTKAPASRAAAPARRKPAAAKPAAAKPAAKAKPVAKPAAKAKAPTKPAAKAATKAKPAPRKKKA